MSIKQQPFADEPHQDNEAQIVAEIAARLLEWAELTSKTRVSLWLDTLHALRHADPAAVWLYIAWQTGDTSKIAASFDEQGNARALPRQAVQQATAKAFEAIAKVKPELAFAMRETFEMHIPEAEKTCEGVGGAKVARQNKKESFSESA